MKTYLVIFTFSLSFISVQLFVGHSYGAVWTYDGCIERGINNFEEKAEAKLFTEEDKKRINECEKIKERLNQNQIDKTDTEGTDTCSAENRMNGDCPSERAEESEDSEESTVTCEKAHQEVKTCIIGNSACGYTRMGMLMAGQVGQRVADVQGSYGGGAAQKADITAVTATTQAAADIGFAQYISSLVETCEESCNKEIKDCGDGNGNCKDPHKEKIAECQEMKTRSVPGLYWSAGINTIGAGTNAFIGNRLKGLGNNGQQKLLNACTKPHGVPVEQGGFDLAGCKKLCTEARHQALGPCNALFGSGDPILPGRPGGEYVRDNISHPDFGEEGAYGYYDDDNPKDKLKQVESDNNQGVGGGGSSKTGGAVPFGGSSGGGGGQGDDGSGGQYVASKPPLDTNILGSAGRGRGGGGFMQGRRGSSSNNNNNNARKSPSLQDIMKAMNRKKQKGTFRRKLAGFRSKKGVASKSENLFKLIHKHMAENCKNHRLYNCQ